jgi:alpha-tubulin suppressor-like RCC1 family protein
MDDNPEWTQIECGKYHTVGLTKNGEVFSWGDNSYGQLGHFDKRSRDTPTRVLSLAGFVVIKISCGDHHTAALTDKGDIFTWYVYWNINTRKTEFLSIFIILKSFFRNNQQGLWL